MTQLADITLVAVATQEVDTAVAALDYSRRGLDFGEILLVSHQNPLGDDAFYRYAPITSFSSVGDWGKYVVFDLHKQIKTQFILLIHEDGFVVNPKSWNNQWRDYDYIGAPFPLPKDMFSYRDATRNIIRVGNSVSLRSKRLLELPSEIGLTWDNFDGGLPHEDGFLCVQHRHTLAAHGIRYAPLEVAVHFGREANLPEHAGIDPFTFHKWAGPNRSYPCFNPQAVRSKKWRRIRRKLKELAGL